MNIPPAREMAFGAIWAICLVLAAFLVALAFVPAPADAAEPFVITHSDGGSVDAFIDQANALRAAHTPVIIDGPCYSACTIMVDSIADQVCVTREAVLGFHMARQGSDGLSPTTSRFAWETVYSPVKYRTAAITAWIAARGGLPKGEMILMTYVDAAKIFRPCPELSRFTY